MSISLAGFFLRYVHQKRHFYYSKNAQSLVCSCTSYGHRHHCLMSFHFERCYCREKMSIAESWKKGREGWRKRERDWQLIAFQCIYSIFLWYHFWTVKKEFYLYETDCFIYKFLCSFFFISIVPIPNAFKNQASERERKK